MSFRPSAPGALAQQALVCGAAVVVLLPATVLLGAWTASTSGTTRGVALATTALLLVGLHLLVRRVARHRLRPRVLSVSALAGAVGLASFALALVLSALSLNPVLYELSRGDLLLAALVVASTSLLLLAHGSASAHEARAHPRIRRSGDLGA